MADKNTPSFTFLQTFTNSTTRRQPNRLGHAKHLRQVCAWTLTIGKIAVLMASLAGLCAASSSSIAVVASPNPTQYGAQVTITASISPSSASGKVTFYDGVSVIGTSVVVSGTATLKTMLSSSGPRSLKAYYSGESQFSASISAIFPETVQTVFASGFSSMSSVSSPNFQFPTMSSGDFNSDGQTDIVVTNRGDASVSILLGNGNGTFTKTSQYPGGSDPFSVAVGDLDGDGNTDIVLADDSAGTVRVMLGKGDGTFQNPVLYPAGIAPVCLVLGDFNRDGALDVAIADESGNRIGILLGHGDGTLSQPSWYAVGSFPRSLVLADFNGDAKADLAVDNLNDGSLTVLLGNGDGTFQPTTYNLNPTGTLAYMAGGDFNNDGKPDVAITVSSPNPAVMLLLGNGDGTFASAARYDVGASLSYIGVADFNADGTDDLVVAENYPVSSANQPSSFALLFGNQNGSLQMSPYHDGLSYTGGGPFVLADLNGDGRVDVVASLGGGLTTYLGLAPTDLGINKLHAGNFAQGQSGAVYTISVQNVGSNPTAGQVTVSDALPNGLAYSSGTGTGWNCSGYGQSATCTRSDTLPAGASYPPISLSVNVSASAPILVTNTASVSIAGLSDTNPANDSASDPTSIVQQQTILFGTLPDRVFGTPPFTLTATVNSGLTINFAGAGNCTVTGNTVTLTSAGSCTITASQAGDAPHTPAANVVRSFTIAAVLSTVSMTASPNPAAFGAPIVLTAAVSPSASLGRVAFYDGNTWLGSSNVSAGTATITAQVNATGVRKLTARYIATAPYAGALSPPLSLPVNPVPAFGFTPSSLPGPATDVAVGDINGDGKLDIVTAGYPTSVFLGNGDGTFAPATQLNGFMATIRVALGDFNGDGIPDIVTSNQYSGQMSVFLGAGGGIFNAPVNSNIADGSLVVADFNGDGLADLAIGHALTGTIGVLLGKGDGTFENSTEYPVQASLIAVGDFDGDGYPDLVGVTGSFSNSSWEDNAISVLKGRGDGTFLLPAKASIDRVQDNGPVAIAVGDLNGDGRLDLTILNSTFGAMPAISTLLGNGDGTFSLAGHYPITYAYFAGSQFSSISSASPRNLGLADLDGDGKLDVVAGFSFSTSGYIQLLPGNGDGTLQPAAAYAVTGGFGSTTLAAGDFNGDGRVDFAAASGSSTVNVLLGTVNPFLRISKTHVGNFTEPLYSAAYTISVNNAAGASPTTGTVTVSDGPSDPTIYSMAGAGWNCQSQTCTRSDVLAGGASYPPITVLADVPYTAISPVHNTANLWGGNSPPVQVTDSAVLLPYPIGCSLTLGSSSASFGRAGGSGAFQIITQPGCEWQISALPSWVTAVSRPIGSGSASFAYTVSANSGPAQSATLFAGGLGFTGPEFTISQAGANQAPQVIEVNPAAGTGSQQLISFVFSDADGAQDLDVENILIRDVLDGSQACYLAYSRPLNILYLVNDAGNALLSGMALNGTGSIGNSQCSVKGAGSAAGFLDNTLILSLNLTFAPAFSGNKIIYLAARDSVANNTGWQAAGTWNVPGSPPPVGPSVTGVTPAASAQTPYYAATFTFSFADTLGWGNLGVVDILINNYLDGNRACYIAFNASQNVVYLVNDPGNALLTPLLLYSGSYVGNSQCSINSVGSSVAASGNNLTLTLNLSFRPGLVGDQVIYMAARSTGDIRNSGWQAVGTVKLP